MSLSLSLKFNSEIKQARMGDNLLQMLVFVQCSKAITYELVSVSDVDSGYFHLLT